MFQGTQAPAVSVNRTGNVNSNLSQTVSAENNAPQSMVGRARQLVERLNCFSKSHQQNVSRVSGDSVLTARATVEGISESIQRGAAIVAAQDHTARPSDSFSSQLQQIRTIDHGYINPHRSHVTSAVSDLNALERNIEIGGTEVLDLYLEQGGDPNRVLNSGLNLLAVAANHGRLGLVEKLLAAGAEVDHPNTMMSPLARAAAFGHVKVVDRLIDGGADVNSRINMFSETPLHFSVARPITSRSVKSSQQHDVVDHLIKAGADVNLTESNGSTPLDYASEHNVAPEIIKRLVSAGAQASR